jgi:hypothetical protein
VSCIYYCIFVGEGITIPIGRQIDGTYLDSNVKDIKKQFEKFKDDWPTHDITLMCDIPIPSRIVMHGDDSRTSRENNW